MNTEQELHKARWFTTAPPSTQEDMKHFVAMAVAHAKAEARREVMEEIKKLQKSRILQKESNARGNARTEGYWKACRDMLKLLTHLSKDKEV